jgi:trk system potassium uptake protein TrkA
MEFLAKPGSKSTKGTIKDIKFPKNSIIGGIIRGNSSFIAKGDTRIKPNDRVVAFALPSALKDIGKYFRNNGT